MTGVRDELDLEFELESGEGDITGGEYLESGWRDGFGSENSCGPVESFGWRNTVTIQHQWGELMYLDIGERNHL